jgi:hypothetical protein
MYFHGSTYIMFAIEKHAMYCPCVNEFIQIMSSNSSHANWNVNKTAINQTQDICYDDSVKLVLSDT